MKNLKYYIPSPIRDFFYGIYNIIRWSKVIYKDRDWDEYYIFEILKFKLKNQSKYIGSYDRHLNAKRDSQLMMTCVKLIDKITDEYYLTEYMDYCTTEIVFDESESSEYSYLNVITKDENFGEYFKKYPLIYSKVKSGEIKYSMETKTDRGIAMTIALHNQERVYKLLFKILENNIHKWWD